MSEYGSRGPPRSMRALLRGVRRDLGALVVRVWRGAPRSRRALLRGVRGDLGGSVTGDGCAGAAQARNGRRRCVRRSWSRAERRRRGHSGPKRVEGWQRGASAVGRCGANALFAGDGRGLRASPTHPRRAPPSVTRDGSVGARLATVLGWARRVTNLVLQSWRTPPSHPLASDGRVLSDGESPLRTPRRRVTRHDSAGSDRGLPPRSRPRPLSIGPRHLGARFRIASRPPRCRPRLLSIRSSDLGAPRSRRSDLGHPRRRNLIGLT